MSSNQTYVDETLKIKEKPRFYEKLKREIDEEASDRVYEANNRIDVIRARLIEYFNFYDCHNGSNEYDKETIVVNDYDDNGQLKEPTHNNNNNDGTIIPEISKDDNEEYIDLANIDLLDLVENTPNTDDTFLRNEQIRKLKKENKRKQLSFRLDELLQDLIYIEEITTAEDVKTPAWIRFDYLVGGMLFEFFDMFLPYLSRFLRKCRSNNNNKKKSNNNNNMTNEITMRLRDLFLSLCSASNAKEIYTYTMAYMEQFRKSIIFPDLLYIIRKSFIQIKYLKREKFIVDAAPTILKCFTFDHKHFIGIPLSGSGSDDDDDEYYDDYEFSKKRLTNIDQYILKNLPPHVKRFDKSHKDLKVDDKSNQDELGKAVEAVANQVVPDVVEQLAKAKNIPDPLKPTSLNTEVGINHNLDHHNINTPVHIEHLTQLLNYSIEFIQQKDVNKPNEKALESPFTDYTSRKMRRVVTAIVLKIYEPWLHVDMKYVSNKIRHNLNILKYYLHKDGFTFYDILKSQYDYMPWTRKGIQKRLKDRNYKDEIEPDDPYFVKDNYEPDMQKMDSDDEEEETKKKIYLSTKGISWMAYMLLFCKEKEEEEDEEEEEEEEKNSNINSRKQNVNTLLEPHDFSIDLYYFPQVYSKEYVVRLFIPIIRFMILNTSSSGGGGGGGRGTNDDGGLNIIQRRGIEMMTWIIDFAYDDILLKYNQIDCPNLTQEEIHLLRNEENPKPNDDGDVLAFAEAMITLTCTIKGNSKESMMLRNKCWQYVCKFIDLFTPNTSYNLIYAIVETCPYTNIIGLLLDRVLVYVQRYYPAARSSSNMHSDENVVDIYYISNKINELLWYVLDKINETNGNNNNGRNMFEDNHAYGCDIYNSIDIYCSSFNIFRFLLIRDKKNNICELWPDIISKGYFKKIKDVKYNLNKKIDARMIDLKQAHPSIKNEFQREVLRLNMMDDVVTRVIELIEEDDRYKLLK